MGPAEKTTRSTTNRPEKARRWWNISVILRKHRGEKLIKDFWVEIGGRRLSPSFFTSSMQIWLSTNLAKNDMWAFYFWIYGLVHTKRPIWIRMIRGLLLRFGSYRRVVIH